MGKSIVSLALQLGATYVHPCGQNEVDNIRENVQKLLNIGAVVVTRSGNSHDPHETSEQEQRYN